MLFRFSGLSLQKIFYPKKLSSLFISSSVTIYMAAKRRPLFRRPPDLGPEYFPRFYCLLNFVFCFTVKATRQIENALCPRGIMFFGCFNSISVFFGMNLRLYNLNFPVLYLSIVLERGVSPSLLLMTASYMPSYTMVYLNVICLDLMTFNMDFFW